MTTFDQRADMQRLIETLARMTTPYDCLAPDITEDEREEITAELDDSELCSDAQALYSVIEQARAILKARGTRR